MRNVLFWGISVFFGVPGILQAYLRRLPLPPEAPMTERIWEALRPQRCWLLWFAIMDQLRYLTYLPLYLRVTWAYKRHPALYKGITYGSPSNHALDVFVPPNVMQTSPTIAIFVHGGAWEHGDRTLYIDVGRSLALHGFSALVMDYTKANDGHLIGKDIGDVSDSTTDVLRALVWATSTVRPEYFLSGRNKIILIGHSSGAHLVCNAVLGLMARSISSNRKCDVTHLHSDIEAALKPAVARKLLKRISCVVGLSGVYDIANHMRVEKARGVEWVSAMRRVMNGPDDFALHSPSKTIEQLSICQTNCPCFLLMHGTDDVTVPIESSTKFAHALTAAGLTATLEKVRGACHTSILMGLMNARKDSASELERRISNLLSNIRLSTAN